MAGPDDSHRPDRWPEPAPPPMAVRLFVVGVVGLLATGVALYGAATAQADSDAFLLFLGAAVISAAVAIRQAMRLLGERRRRRDS